MTITQAIIDQDRAQLNEWRSILSPIEDEFSRRRMMKPPIVLAARRLLGQLEMLLNSAEEKLRTTTVPPQTTRWDRGKWEREQQEWLKSLTPAEKKAINEFTRGDHVLIRDFEQGRGSQSDKARALAESLKSALDKAPKYTGEVYRGVQFESLEAQLKYLTVGNEVDFLATSSATKSLDVAAQFAVQGQQLKQQYLSTVFKIKTSSGVEIEDLAQSRYKWQQEVLLRKDAKYRVVEVRQQQGVSTLWKEGSREDRGKANVTIVTLEEIKPTAAPVVPPPPPATDYDESGRFKPKTPIQQRLVEWKDGDAKLEVIRQRAKDVEALPKYTDKDIDEMKKQLVTLQDEYYRLLNRRGAELKARDKHREMTRLQQKIDGDVSVDLEKFGRQRAAAHTALSEAIKDKPHVVVDLKKSRVWKDGEYILQEAKPERRERLEEGISWVRDQLVSIDDAKLNVQTHHDPNRGNRAYCYDNPEGWVSSIYLGAKSSKGVAVHELGHAIEKQVPGIKAAVDKFLEYRCAGETPQQLKKVLPDRGYKADEYGRKDKFEAAFGDSAWYVGKDYQGRYTEVLSMGIEKLHDDPVGFIDKDPEYAKFIIGILDGSLRET